jgi:hypothetical protein
MDHIHESQSSVTSTVVHNDGKINETAYRNRSTATVACKLIRQKLCRMARKKDIDLSMNWGLHVKASRPCVSEANGIRLMRER